MNISELTVVEFLVWLKEYARDEHNGDRGLALLELELQGMLD